MESWNQCPCRRRSADDDGEDPAEEANKGDFHFGCGESWEVDDKRGAYSIPYHGAQLVLKAYANQARGLPAKTYYLTQEARDIYIPWFQVHQSRAQQLEGSNPAPMNASSTSLMASGSRSMSTMVC